MKQECEALLKTFENALFLSPTISSQETFRNQWAKYLETKMAAQVLAEKHYREESQRFGMNNPFLIESRARSEALKTVVQYAKKLNPNWISRKGLLPPGEEGGRKHRIQVLLRLLKQDILMENRGNALLRVQEIENLLGYELYPTGSPSLF